MRIAPAEIEAAIGRVSPETLRALSVAAERITQFHRRQTLTELSYLDPAGVRLGARFTPLDAAGLYVPGGLAAYPSSVLMNAIPAKVAGVPRLAMVVPTRSEEHTSELQSLMRTSYAVFCLKKKNNTH